MFCVFASIPFVVLSQTSTLIEGYIHDKEGKAIPYATVVIANTQQGIASNIDGFYQISLSESDSVELKFSSIGYQSEVIKVSIKKGQKLRVDIVLKAKASEIDEVSIISSNRRFGNIERINHRDIEFIPDASGSFEAILKSLPGVSSTHEMSSQYSVRGGNFDENLVYVNDIEIYRPFLIRSGQQEGLSFINSDMVEGVEFSAGGFNAEYGDKMSSVLNIRYRTPYENSARTDMSLLGASGLVEGTGRYGDFTHITGFRYKTSQYLLASLDAQGDYKPAFFDIQSNLSWRVTPKFKLSILGNFSSNSYQFVPEERETRFGSFSNALQLRVFYEGQEMNKFETMQGAITGEIRPNNYLSLKFIGGGYIANETETFDILGQYLLNELDNTLGSSTYSDSIINVGIGGFLNHARNFLNANFYRVEHLGSYTTEKNNTKWGIKYQYEKIVDQISEWDLIDSSGYAVPYNGSELTLPYFLQSNNSILSHRLGAYFQNSFKHKFAFGEMTLTAGVRASFWSYSNITNISPRATIMIKPKWKQDIAFHLSGGYYYQPPLYKEFRLSNGALNPNIKSQKSIHAVLGVEYLFRAWNRPFRFQTEIYHKELSNLIPYKVDNVRIQYAGENLADGFAQGIDFKINGDFVEGAESWASLSIMRSLENIKNDQYQNEDGKIIYPGYYPRPTDQRISIGAFFQDYIPRNPTYRVHLTGFFGTGLPFSAPNMDRYDITARMPSYKRIDIGFSKVFKDVDGKRGNSLTKLTWLKGFWVSAEVFNLFDFENTISYLWVQTVSNQSAESGNYAVPNFLTSRRINIKISAKF